MDVAAHIIVKGRVQGVSFRYFTIDKAIKLELDGWVRNLPNGDVEVWAEGDRGLVESLIEELKVGPRFAAVKDLQIEWEKPTYKEKGFNLKW
jgi:acylphosphatase